MPLRQSDSLIAAKAQKVIDLIDAGSAAGYFEVRTGSQPATPAATASGTLLATVTFADPCGTRSGGVVTFSDPVSVDAVATGTAGWCRFYDSDDNVVFDGHATTSGGGGVVTFTTLALVLDEAVDCTGGTWTEAM